MSLFLYLNKLTSLSLEVWVLLVMVRYFVRCPARLACRLVPIGCERAKPQALLPILLWEQASELGQTEHGEVLCARNSLWLESIETLLLKFRVFGTIDLTYLLETGDV